MSEDPRELATSIAETITKQLRTLGVVLHDDLGMRIRPGSPEEARIVNNIANNVACYTHRNIGCQTSAVGSCMCPREVSVDHLQECPEFPEYLKS